MKKRNSLAIIGSLATATMIGLADYLGYWKGVDDVAKVTRAVMLRIVTEQTKSKKEPSDG